MTCFHSNETQRVKMSPDIDISNQIILAASTWLTNILTAHFPLSTFLPCKLERWVAKDHSILASLNINP